MCVVAAVAYRVEMMTTLKIRKNCAGPCLIQLLLESFNTVEAKKAQSKGSSSLGWGPFQPLGPNQP